MTKIKKWHILFVVTAVGIFLYSFNKKPCLEIIPSQGEVGQILLNKCTSKTWMLTRSDIPNDKGKATGKYTYDWVPILYSPEGTAVWTPRK